ncbi:DNA helicase KNAG_0M01440 [Huiozyma naganishii CBS 8797]|uniref:ATP-dependent DNA helicase RRM3 n=1 Tax=Huiozyma naganishii (strain ATCC MYA-139 / BCRC 22969 / CBS 8797 / KCTC 17520 / NBRC 10181 / NCYC 3082 / Yp74L-3) TaxID=1071383 RepID=J7S460_HUIN7|nr:hypothetical protein KNAG_0M01440 [Kazachstania naganishii CBS 8797]CCK72997.1 hypothetical protein KNAG_0M01440 [Kazachstania naganishii CBS 8797]
MQRSKPFGANGSSQKPRQKSICTFFSSAKSPGANGISRASPQVQSGSAKDPITLNGPVPKLVRTSSSALFSYSQGSFDEENRDEELKRLVTVPQLNNFKRTASSLSRQPSFPRSNSSLSASSAASPTKIERRVVQLEDEQFREVTNVTTGRRQLSFTSTQMDNVPATSTQLSQPMVSLPEKRPLSGGLNLSNAKRLKPITNNRGGAKHANGTSGSLQGAKNDQPMVRLTREQEYVVELIVKRRMNVFYTGSAGTGKSVILRNIVSKLSKLYGEECVAVTASTGLAAATIGGVTLHKWSSIGIGNRPLDVYVKKLTRQRESLMVWRKTKVLIVDEVSMIDGNFLTKLEFIARALRRNERPFGGIQLVFTGDFFQLPPVTKRDAQVVSQFCFETEAWRRCIEKTILLKKVFRQQDDELIDILNSIRFGEIEKDMTRAIRSLEREVKYEDGIMPTEIYATRREVESSNARQLHNLPGSTYKYDAEDVAPREMMPMLDSVVMAEKVLVLKEDAQVMMLKNRPDVDLVNGTLGKVLFFTTERLSRKFIEMFKTIDEDTVLDMRIVSQAIAKRQIHESQGFQQALQQRPLSRYQRLQTMINHAMNESPSERVYPFVRWSTGKSKRYHELVLPDVFAVDLPGNHTGLQRTQLPVMLCWALSIHKAQGQTIPRLKVDLRNIFEAGQVYVALSRAVSRDSIQVTNFNPSKIRANEKVKQFYRNLETVN